MEILPVIVVDTLPASQVITRFNVEIYQKTQQVGQQGNQQNQHHGQQGNQQNSQEGNQQNGQQGNQKNQNHQVLIHQVLIHQVFLIKTRIMALIRQTNI
jgi:hypothetical protein